MSRAVRRGSGSGSCSLWPSVRRAADLRLRLECLCGDVMKAEADRGSPLAAAVPLSANVLPSAETPDGLEEDDCPVRAASAAATLAIRAEDSADVAPENIDSSGTTVRVMIGIVVLCDSEPRMEAGIGGAGLGEDVMPRYAGWGALWPGDWSTEPVLKGLVTLSEEDPAVIVAAEEWAGKTSVDE